jgi:hypothetical protein
MARRSALGVRRSALGARASGPLVSGLSEQAAIGDWRSSLFSLIFSSELMMIDDE